VPPVPVRSSVRVGGSARRGVFVSSISLQSPPSVRWRSAFPQTFSNGLQARSKKLRNVKRCNGTWQRHDHVPVVLLLPGQELKNPQRGLSDQFVKDHSPTECSSRGGRPHVMRQSALAVVQVIVVGRRENAKLVAPAMARRGDARHSMSGMAKELRLGALVRG
jgi:hypothetical protein